ncbi:MAG: hypothetical protein ACK5KR_06065 [Breznakia sp.]
MKKILRLNVMVIVVLTTFLTYISYKTADSTAWRTWGSNQNAKTIHVRNTNLSNAQLYTILTGAAKENKVNIVKSNIDFDEKDMLIIKSVFIGKDEALYNPSALLKGDAITIENTERNMCIATQNQKCEGQLFDFLNDDNIEIWTLKKLYASGKTLEGDYSIRAMDVNAIDAYIQQLSQNLNISEKELLAQKNFTIHVEVPLEKISMIVLLMSYLTFAVLCIFYAFNNSKKIGVMKLHGYHNAAIWKELIASIIIDLILMASVTFFILCLALSNLNRDFIFSLVKMMILSLFILLIASGSIYFIIKKNKIGDLIKSKTTNKPLLLINYSVKFIIEVLLLSLIVIFSFSVKDIEYNNRLIKTWDKNGDWAVLQQILMGDDYASFIEGDTKLDEDFAQLYDYLDNEKGIYTLFETIKPHPLFKTEYNAETKTYGYVSYFNPKLVPKNLEFDNFQVNCNYFAYFPLYDLDGEKIMIDNQTSDRLILIPESKMEDAAMFKHVYEAYTINKMESYERKKGEGNTQIAQVHVKTMIYQDNVEGYFTFTSDKNGKDVNVQAPVFDVLTTNNATLLEKSSIRQTGLHSLMKVNVKNRSSEAFNKEMALVLKRLNLADNEVKFIKIREIFALEIMDIREKSLQVMGSLMLVLIAEIFLNANLTKLLIDRNRKKYAIEKLNGLKLFDQYKKLIFGHIVFHSIVSGLVIFTVPKIVHMGLTSLTIMMVLAFVALDMVLTVLLLQILNRKNLIRIVKGD